VAEILRRLAKLEGTTPNVAVSDALAKLESRIAKLERDASYAEYVKGLWKFRSGSPLDGGAIKPDDTHHIPTCRADLLAALVKAHNPLAWAAFFGWPEPLNALDKALKALKEMKT